MKKILVFIMTSSIAFSGHATVCLRAPGVSVKEFTNWKVQHPQCASTDEILYRQMQTDPDQDLEILAAKLKKVEFSKTKQIEIFEDFFNHKKQQAWSKRTIETLVEALKRWNTLAGGKKNLNELIEQLTEGGLLSDEKAVVRIPDWSDAIVFKDARPAKGVGKDLVNHHWVIYSSLYRPVIQWGMGPQVQKTLMRQKNNWLAGTCDQPKLNFNTSAQEDYLFLYPKNCTATRPALFLAINKEQPSISTAKISDAPFYRSPLFWVVSAASALAISAVLKNKSVNVRAGSR